MPNLDFSQGGAGFNYVARAARARPNAPPYACAGGGIPHVTASPQTFYKSGSREGECDFVIVSHTGNFAQKNGG